MGEEDTQGYKITFTYADVHVKVPLSRGRGLGGRKCCLPNGVISHTQAQENRVRNGTLTEMYFLHLINPRSFESK